MSTSNDRAVLNSIFNPLLPTGEFSFSEEFDTNEDGEDTVTTQMAKQLELEGVKVAESGDIRKSLELFTKAIELTPNRPSGYNNRAQAHRLLNNIEGALLDLNNAINLSNRRSQSTCQAYCQRGLIYLHQQKKAEAEKDFQKAAEMGSCFAKSLLAQLNPYAALCNQMLGEVFNKLHQGISDEN